MVVIYLLVFVVMGNKKGELVGLFFFILESVVGYCVFVGGYEMIRLWG